MTCQNVNLQVSKYIVPLLLLFAGAARGQSVASITATTFGMQCGPAESANCEPSGGTITLPSEPGTLRLWDSEVAWSWINSSSGTYDFSTLDEYLNAISSATNVTNVLYTFGWTPCWDVSSTIETLATCEANAPAASGDGSPYPPQDLGTSPTCDIGGTYYAGSCTFDNFVNALTTHCTSGTPSICVKDVIKYYGMWNEPNSTNFWEGTVAQLYEMANPAVSIIKNNVTSAQILTPPISNASTGVTWMNSWITQEKNHGVISDLYSFHTYLSSYTPLSGELERRPDRGECLDWLILGCRSSAADKWLVQFDAVHG
jgi:hypothetical protein